MKAIEAAEVREVRFHDPRHTYGTAMAAAGVPLRTLQEWMGHRDIATTMIYADYCPSGQEGELAEQAFAPRSVPRSNLSESAVALGDLTVPDRHEGEGA
jgi:integrase